MPFKLSFLVMLLFWMFLACNKTTENVCQLTLETNAVPCSASDTTSDINGFTTIHYKGSSQVKSEGHFTNGIRTGFWKYYHLNGKLQREGNFTMGMSDGYWSAYYENGNIRSQGQFTNCRRTSFWKYFYAETNYAVHFEGNYTDNVKNGTWKKYNISGKLQSTHACN